MENPNDLQLTLHFCTECGDYRLLHPSNLCTSCHVGTTEQLTDNIKVQDFKTQGELLEYVNGLIKKS